MLFIQAIALSTYNCASGTDDPEETGAAAAAAVESRVPRILPPLKDLPVTERLASIRAADARRARKNVVILGAGMAGITAACELRKLGHTVTVYEASNRPGGRVWTHKFKDGQYHEYGAMRIPASHDYTRHYIEESALKLRHFVTSHEGERCCYHFRGAGETIANRDAILGRYALSAHERQIASSDDGIPGILGHHLSNVLQSLTPADIAALRGEIPLTERVAQLDRLSLGAFLDQHVERETKELIGAATGLEVWWNVALTMFLREELTKNAEGLEEIEGGTEELPRALVKRHKLFDEDEPDEGKNIIRLRREVTSISVPPKGGKIKLVIQKYGKDGAKDGDPTEEEADHVICTIPFSVLRSMELKGLSPHKMDAIRNLHYESSTKVLLHFKHRFWEDKPLQIFGGASLTDQITRATYYPSDHAPPGFFPVDAAFFAAADSGGSSSSRGEGGGGSAAGSVSMFAVPAEGERISFHGLFTRVVPDRLV